MATAFTVRWYHEGIATSHFSAGTARLTGNPPMDDGPVGVIIGDSHVQAIQVADTETMGAVVERVARQAGVRLTARQYGWSAASPAAYVARAPAILRRWNPAWVVVVLDGSDLEPTALADAPVATIAPDTSLAITGSLVPEEPVGWRGRATLAAKRVARRSVLAWELIQRASTIRHLDDTLPPPTLPTPTNLPVNDELVADASVRSLHRAFGDRLAIVYIATVTATDARPEPSERTLAAACRAQGVPCVSTRTAMIDLRDGAATLARGFENSAPGVGHLNARGHALVGRMIWSLVNTEPLGVVPSGTPAGRP